MKTITIQIGNSDNKLSQQDWSDFVNDVNELIGYYAKEIHFFGAPPNYAPHQNSAWVITCNDTAIENLKGSITSFRKHYNQDSVAFTIGNTEFI